MKKGMCLLLAGVLVLGLTGCGKGDDVSVDVTTTTTTETTVTEGDATGTTGDAAADTMYINVTDADGATVTGEDGAAVTSAVIATTTPTDGAPDETTPAGSEDTGTTVSAANTEPGTSPTNAPTKASTTVPTQVSSTSTTPTTQENTRAIVTNVNGIAAHVYPEDPWKYPYDVDEILRQCKAYVKSKGWIWWDEATLNSSWDTYFSTDYFTWYEESLRNDVFEEIDINCQRAGGCGIVIVPIPLKGDAADPYWSSLKGTGWDFWTAQYSLWSGQYVVFVVY